MGLLLNASMTADDIRTIQRDEYGICPSNTSTVGANTIAALPAYVDESGRHDRSSIRRVGGAYSRKVQWNHQYNYYNCRRRRRVSSFGWYSCGGSSFSGSGSGSGVVKRQRRELDLDVLNCSAELVEEEAEGLEPDAEEGLWALVSISPFAELYLAVRAITPLLAFLLLVFKFALKEPLPLATFGPEPFQIKNLSPLYVKIRK